MINMPTVSTKPAKITSTRHKILSSSGIGKHPGTTKCVTFRFIIKNSRRLPLVLFNRVVHGHHHVEVRGIHVHQEVVARLAVLHKTSRVIPTFSKSVRLRFPWENHIDWKDCRTWELCFKVSERIWATSLSISLQSSAFVLDKNF